MAKHRHTQPLNTLPNTSIGFDASIVINKGIKMFDKIHHWYANYHAEVTWWLIGWLTYAAIDCLVNGNYVFAIADAMMIYFNYYMWKQNVR